MNSKKKSLPNQQLIKTLWAMFVCCLLICPIYIASICFNSFNLYGGLPSLAVLENPENSLSSELYAADGVLLGKYFRHNRSALTYEEISQNVISALLATEDYRFESHAGIDPKGLYRAFLLSILLQRKKGGGSTLSQQLAKNLFKTRSEKYCGLLSNIPILKTIIIKTKEWIVAVQLERSYTKKEIITMYLNTVSFGSNTFGLKVAAKTFFNTTPDSLTINQAALLVGILQAPSYYSPVQHPERAKKRRNVVLTQMCKYYLLKETACLQLKEAPIALQYKVENHTMGLATYFRATIRDFLLKWTKERGYDLFEDGLKIYTTIDSRLQKHAEAAVAAHMPVLQQRFEEHWGNEDPWRDEKGKKIEGFIDKAARQTPLYKRLVEEHGQDQETIDRIMNTPVRTKLFSWEGEIDAELTPIEAVQYTKRLLHTGFMAMNPHTGHIKAWVGGIDYKHFQYDHVIQGKRQAGSVFKPVVYATALDNGYTPWQQVIDAPVTFKVPGGTWTPRNWSRAYTGKKMTLRQAMARSVNSVTAYLMQQLGPQLVVDYAKKLGIQSPLQPVPALCLGSADVSVYELVGAYSTFMNKGVWTLPAYISRIEDKNGKVLHEFSPQKREAVSEKTAYLMMHLLKGTMEEPGGTSRTINKLLREDNEICGKTGTTSNQSDGWFVGMAKDLCAGVWVGGDDRCIHFRELREGSGAKMARPIWEKFMLNIYEDPEAAYEKGPLLPHGKPTGLLMPKQAEKQSIESSSIIDDEIMENLESEMPVIDATVDMKDIF